MLNVVWMEREFDAYKLSCRMCPSNYNYFWDRARYWSKIIIFSYPLAFDASVRGVPIGIAPPRFFTEKLEWLGYPMVKKFQRYLCSFWCNSRTCQTDRRTDTACRHIPRLCIASRGKNRRVFATVMLKCKGSSFFDLQYIFDIFIVKQICNVFICLNVQNVCQLQQVLIWHCQLLLQGLFDVR